MQVQLLSSDNDLKGVAEVLLLLRPQYTVDSLIAQIKKQQKNGYQIAYIKSGDTVLCVAGFVVGEKLAWGKHIYIDDLVTNEKHRSAGAGSMMIDWFKSYCAEIACEQLHLDSGVQRFSAHRFYLRERFNIESHHFSIRDLHSEQAQS